MMFKSSKSEVVTVDTQQKQENPREEHALALQKLKSEETYLMEERQKLKSLKEKLEIKAKEEIELKKNRIQKLKGEITDLKATCEVLTASLNPA